MSVVFCLFALILAARPMSSPAPATPPANGTPLAVLLSEADQHNPDIQQARDSWHAAVQIVPQVSTLPDPEVGLQQMPIGSLVPFSNFSSQMMAYAGVSISQQFPYPGTLGLRKQAASDAGSTAEAQLDVVRRRIHADLRAAYAQLGAVEQQLAILDRDGQLLGQVEQIAEARYRVGQGSEQEVLRAQLEETMLQRDVALEQQNRDALQARLKALLGRPQTSADITAFAPTETKLSKALPDLLEQVQGGNPAVRGRQNTVEEQQVRVALAHQAFKPDFMAQFAWQHTGQAFLDRYMLALSVRVPLYWRHRQVPALAEASDRLAAARAAYTSQLQSDQARLRDQFARAQTADRLLTIYRQGLIPQARAAFQAGLAAYQSGRLDFESLLASFRDVLTLDRSYWQALADHETAIARIEQVTGVAGATR